MNKQIEEIYKKVAEKPAEYLSENPELTKNKKFMLKICELNGEALDFASTKLQDDPEIVLAAVKSSATSLKYASDRLKNDPEFIGKLRGNKPRMR